MLNAMSTRVSAHRAPAASRSRAAEKNLPPISVGAALSKKIDSAIVKPDAKSQRQLKFTQKHGFVSPSGNQLQVVYLAPKSSKSGLDITYVDAKAKQFW